MEDFLNFLIETFNLSGFLPVILIVLVLIGIVPLVFGVFFLVDAVNLVLSSRIVIKGKEEIVLDYPCTVDSVTQCESSGLIRSNVGVTRTSSDQFIPDALRKGERIEDTKSSYNYDDTDGIPAVDRPLFKPKE